MADDQLTQKQRALAELELRRRETIKNLGPVFDWYGKPCFCKEYDAEKQNCKKHPRALPHQRPPDGIDWLTWMMLAGRSSGKTRASAEWIRYKVESHAAKGEQIRIALVNETVSEVRRVQIEGASGLLAVSPPWFMPVYIPSKAEVVWPNGSVAYIFSGEQPDQLRGPQHHYAWCLPGWTQVLMGDGTEKPISDVAIGDKVMTRAGARTVTASMMTRRSAQCLTMTLSDGRTLTATAEHPVYIEGRGFVPLGQLKPGMLVCAIDASFTMESLITSGQKDTTRQESDFIVSYGSKHLGQSPRDLTSTTRTATNSTIELKTLNCFSRQSIADTTLPFISRPTSEKKRQKDQLPKCIKGGMPTNKSFVFVRCAKASTLAGLLRHLLSARRHAWKKQGLVDSQAKAGFARIAERLIQHTGDATSIAQRIATTVHRKCDMRIRNRFSRQLNANNAAKSLTAGELTQGSAQDLVPLTTTLEIQSVQPCRTLLDVYDLTVDKEHEFFANRLLVRNCDELCLTPDTIITCADFDKPISQVVPGDMVLTRAGYRPVVAAWKTTDLAVVYRLTADDGSFIVGTAGHPVWVEGEGWVPLANVKPGSRLRSLTSCRALSGEVVDGGSMAHTTCHEKENCFIGRFTQNIMGQSRRTWTFTIKTFAKLITQLKTLRRLREVITSSLIGSLAGQVHQRKSLNAGSGLGIAESLFRIHVSGATNSLSAKLHMHTTAPKNAEIGTSGTLAQIAGLQPSQSEFEARYLRELESHTKQRNQKAGSQKRGRSSLCLSALSAKHSLRPKTVAALHAVLNAGGHYEKSVGPRSVSVERLPERSPVYNIEVEGEHEYFANGILTHNCKWSKAQAQVWDNLLLGMRLGNNPQIVVSTTPQPTPTLRAIIADKFTKISKASTYANRNNLPEKFFESVVNKYEGTRIGRQELHAEVLLQNQNALWNQAQIDSLRVRSVPYGVELKRIAVGVDPAGKISEMAKFVHGMPTESGSGDEAGVVVAGLGTDGHGYILGDHSTGGSPSSWGKAVGEAYHRHQANVVVWESNHGGDTVRDVILTVDPNIVQKRVHASRSKYVRAEPIGALSEQGKIHIVGELPQLESEMCEFEPGGPSPNRLDAMVFALTDLMIQIEEEDKQELPFNRISIKGLF
jgi:phage terminase large subunit-like protein